MIINDLPPEAREIAKSAGWNGEQAAAIMAEFVILNLDDLADRLTAHVRSVAKEMTETRLDRTIREHAASAAGDRAEEAEEEVESLMPGDAIRSLIDDVSRIEEDDLNRDTIADLINETFPRIGLIPDDLTGLSGNQFIEGGEIFLADVLPEQLARDVYRIASKALSVAEGAADTTDLDVEIISAHFRHGIECDGVAAAMMRQG